MTTGTHPTAEARRARRRLAELIRQLASGRLTNDEFEKASPRFVDRAVVEIYEFAWSFYDDLYEHRLLARHRLSPLQRRVFALCVLFLRSDHPYEWPKRAKWLWCRQSLPSSVPWWKPDVAAAAMLPAWGRRARQWRRRLEAEEDRRIRNRTFVDDRIWPFRRMADLKAALIQPLYLAGRATG